MTGVSFSVYDVLGVSFPEEVDSRNNVSIHESTQFNEFCSQGDLAYHKSDVPPWTCANARHKLLPESVVCTHQTLNLNVNYLWVGLTLGPTAHLRFGAPETN